MFSCQKASEIILMNHASISLGFHIAFWNSFLLVWMRNEDSYVKNDC